MNKYKCSFLILQNETFQFETYFLFIKIMFEDHVFNLGLNYID